MFQSPGPILLKMGSLTIRWYGVMIALGFLAATFAAAKLAKRWKIDPDKIVNCALICFIAGIVGARLYFVALSWGYFSQNPGEILATWNGGLSIHGGMIGALLGGIVYCKISKLPILTCADIIGAVVALGQAIGRWGNFFNSEAFGRPVSADFPLRLYIPPADRPAIYQNSDYFHPTFLYESVWDLLVFLVLYFVAADRLKKYPGTLFMLYMASYSIGRLFIETLRTDSITFNGMPVPIIASAAILLLSLIGFFMLLTKYKRLGKQISEQ